MIVRKLLFQKETLHTDELGRASAPVTRAAAMAVVQNPFAGVDAEDLSDLFRIATDLGPDLAKELVSMLPNPPVAYGKAALVGAAGAMEHGAAVLHPKLGAPVRAAIGGGKSLMPSNHKIGSLGDRIDLPLGHKDDPWAFDFIDTVTLCVADAPRANELVLCIGLSDGTRMHPRVGSGPASPFP